MSTDETDDGPDDGPDEAEAPGAEGPAGVTAEGAGRKRRRRRRRRHGEGPAAPEGQAAAPGAQAPAEAPARPVRQWQGGGGGAPAADASAEAPSQPQSSPQPQPQRTDGGGNERGRRRRGERGPRDGGQAPREAPRDPAQREAQRREPRRDDQRREPRRDDQRRGPAPAQAGAAGAPAPRTYEAPTPRLEQQQRRPAPAADDDHLETTGDRETPTIAWGTDDDGPPPVVTLAPDLPAEAPPDDPDPLTYPLLDAASFQLGDDIANVVGVRFMPGGRIQWCDAGDADYAIGERVIVDSDRGQRLATVGSPPTRRATRDRGLRRVVRRANDNDLRGERSGDEDRAKALRIAKDAAAALRLPLKVFRVEMHGAPGRGAKLNVYYTSDERLDLRELIRDVGNGTGARIELRQLGVRDEAKAVGGIGSCGLTLCCTTWLPDFVPVSIKMAKDQGLVLSPTKVSGQCGRLKCCLVYEQAAYAELRKGLPKLGKRVISARGEGRVVEVDVLRQRIRVSYGMGDTEVLPATEVKPLFPPGNQPQRARADDDDAPDEEPQVPIDDPLLAPPEEDHGPTDDPSSDDYQP